MNDVQSTLVAHCGARKVTRQELKEIPVPEGTKTHQPLSHYEIVEVLEEALSFRYLKVVRDEYAVSQDGMKMFGVMDLNNGFEGGRFSIGLRNSNDKSMRLALTAGYRVFVCDNMAFSGDFTPLLHKHTRNLELKDSITIAVDRIQRGFNSLESRVKEMQDFGLTDNDARLFIYRAFLEKAIRGIPRNLMSDVHEHYFNPSNDAFEPRNLWSLSNAFTSAFKNLAPIRQFEVTARLGTYLSDIQEDANRTLLQKIGGSDSVRINPYEHVPQLSAWRGNERSPSAVTFNSDDSMDGDDVATNADKEEYKQDDADDRYEEFNRESEHVEDNDSFDDNIDEIMEEFERKIAA